MGYFMNIGEAAKATRLSAKMIRHYEAIDLVPVPDRQASGYREYSEADRHRLAFVRRARELGFSIERIRDLLLLWGDRNRAPSDVRKVALSHVVELEEKAAQIQTMIKTLRSLATSCAKGRHPHCPIIDELGGGMHDAPPATAARRTGSLPR
jgi:Cu(I)-responsive transcriptional regulator